MMATDGFTLAAQWWWMIGAVILAVAEILAPGFFLIWLAVAALLTGFAAMIPGVPLAAQLGLFALAAIAAIYGARKWLGKNPIVSSDPLLNDRVARLVGEIVVVIEPIEAGRGRVRVADGVWSARGSEVPAGARVRIIGAEGTTLIVESV
jgi:membrane protein implicated in regulation of membrane protease activity